MRVSLLCFGLGFFCPSQKTWLERVVFLAFCKKARGFWHPGSCFVDPCFAGCTRLKIRSYSVLQKRISDIFLAPPHEGIVLSPLGERSTGCWAVLRILSFLSWWANLSPGDVADVYWAHRAILFLPSQIHFFPLWSLIYDETSLFLIKDNSKVILSTEVMHEICPSSFFPPWSCISSV